MDYKQCPKKELKKMMLEQVKLIGVEIKKVITSFEPTPDKPEQIKILTEAQNNAITGYLTLANDNYPF